MEPNEKGPVAVTDATFAKTVLEAPQPKLVDFGAEWCGPCVAVAPVIRTLALEYADRLRSGQEYRAAIEDELH